MFVRKRDGRKEEVKFDKITSRIQKLCFGLSPLVDPVQVSQQVCLGVYQGVATHELDELAAQTAAHMVTVHPDYGTLAARISVSNLHKNTHDDFSKVIDELHNYIEPKTGLAAPLISQDVFQIVMDNADEINAVIDYGRDFEYDYFGFKTLERAYLLKMYGEIVERPQHMLMRVSIGIHKEDLKAVFQTYDLMSMKWFTHASPTMFNSGTPRPQMSSCFLISMKDDSIEGIYDTLKQCAMISKNAGGIGISVHNVRSRGSYIRGTNGTSNGLVPMLRVFNDTARYVDQGGGKRKGSFAMYLELWHSDIFEFLEMRKNHGKEENRARDLFYAVWVCDLFMKRVEQGGDWNLMCPNECPGLFDCWGEEFESMYEEYERNGQFKKTIKARDLWKAILDSQIETGTPYIMYKDSCNRKSNQQHLGTIRSSNLCCEIVEYSSPDEVAVCNLASIALSRFVEDREFNFQKLHDITKIITRNLNKVIDLNYYPIPEAKLSNMRHRPIGIGVQGLADAFILMRYPFSSPEAKDLNKKIFETIYFAAMTASMELAKTCGPYSSYEGSPVSNGVFQFDMWGDVELSGMWDWSSLRKEIAEHGTRNSLLVAPMPTASTSQILGNNECFEPYTSNIYTRRVLAGEFMCVNRHLLKDLVELGLWDDLMKDQLLANGGSVAPIDDIPDELKRLYKTVWEIRQRDLIDMASDRAPFIDQSQSMNIFMQDASFRKLTSMHFYAWKKGLKTGLYYLRTKAATDAVKFTLKPTTKASKRNTQVEEQKEKNQVPSRKSLALERSKSEPQPQVGNNEANSVATRQQQDDIEKAKLLCSLENRDSCLMCGS